MVDTDKLHQVALFFLHGAPNHQLGVSKLWKLLYYVDLMHLEQFGHTVTHAAYRKTKHGPLPDGGMDLLEPVVRDGRAERKRVRRFQHEQVLFRGQAPPELHDFGFSERAILAETTLHWMRATTAQLESAIRHSGPWGAIKYGEALNLDA